MIRLNLEVTDPTRSDASKLLALAALFTSLAQGTSAEQQREALDKAVSGSARTVGAPAALAAPYAGQVVGAGAQLDQADNPATGMPSPAEAFGTTMGNGAAGSASASFPSLASTGADLTTVASASSETGGHSAPAASLPDPVAAFGGSSAPNVPPVPAPGTASLPPAPPSVPSAAGAPAAAPAGVDLDAEGLPWDATINAMSADGGHPKTADGKWKKKRGVGETYVNGRKAQLRAALAAGNAAAPAGVNATPPGNAAVPPPAGAGAPVPPPPPSSPGNVPVATLTPPVSQPTTPAAAGSNSLTLAQVLPRVTAAMASGLLTPDSSAAIVREISEGKIDNVAMLAVAPALIPALVARLDALGIPA